MTAEAKARLTRMHKRWEHQDRKYVVYRGTQPAYRVSKVNYDEAIWFLSIAAAGSLLFAWLYSNVIAV